MPKIISGLRSNRFLIEIIIQKVKLDKERNSFIYDDKGIRTLALIDTGATISVICNGIAKDLELGVIGQNQVQTAGGQTECPIFNAMIHIPSDINPTLHPNDPNDLSKGSRIVLKPNSMVARLVRASGSDYLKEQGIGALLGMDVLNHSHLTITDGLLTMSF